MVLDRERLESRLVGSRRHYAHLMNQDVTAVTGVDCRLGRVRIAGDDNAAVWRIEPVSIALHGVLRLECCDRNVGILVNNSGFDFVRVDLGTFWNSGETKYLAVP